MTGAAHPSSPTDAPVEADCRYVIPTGLMPTEPEKVEVHYIKSNFFRVVHADGVFGGVAPTGRFSLAVYNERNPIPQSADFDLVGHKLLNEQRHGKQGIVREVEVNIIMDYPLAVSLRQWLDDKIAEHDRLTKEFSPK